METNGKIKTSTKLNKIDIYKAEMEEIGFLAEHFDDFPEIFDARSEKSKLFLVKVFTMLNMNFHYLSFLGNESIGQELAKAAFILRIYPYNSDQKSNEIFKHLSEMEVHRFWMKFFKLCKINSLYVDSNLISRTAENISNVNNIFSDMHKTIQYFTYDISVMNSKKLKGIDVNKEIESWFPSSFHTTFNESAGFDHHPEIPYEENCQTKLNIEHLISDIDYIKKKADFENLSISKQSYLYKNFFNSFNLSLKMVTNYKHNINFICSFVIRDLIKNTELHKNSYWQSSNCQIKRCNNIMQNITSVNEKI